MNIFETILVFVVAPAAVFGLAALLTLVPGRAKSHPKYHPGESWDYPPQLWAGDSSLLVTGTADPAATTLGGARGTW